VILHPDALEVLRQVRLAVGRIDLDELLGEGIAEDDQPVTSGPGLPERAAERVASLSEEVTVTPGSGYRTERPLRLAPGRQFAPEVPSLHDVRRALVLGEIVQHSALEILRDSPFFILINELFGNRVAEEAKRTPLAPGEREVRSERVSGLREVDRRRRHRRARLPGQQRGDDDDQGEHPSGVSHVGVCLPIHVAWKLVDGSFAALKMTRIGTASGLSS
jgi:hypothetical protein